MEFPEFGSASRHGSLKEFHHSGNNYRIVPTLCRQLALMLPGILKLTRRIIRYISGTLHTRSGVMLQ